MKKRQKFQVIQKESDDKNIAFGRVKGICYLIVENCQESKINLKSVDDANLYLYTKMTGIESGKKMSNKTTREYAYIVCALYNFCNTISKDIKELRSSDLKQLINSCLKTNNIVYLNNKIGIWIDYLEWFYTLHGLEQSIFFQDELDLTNIGISKGLVKKLEAVNKKNQTFQKQKALFLQKKTIVINKKKSLSKEELTTLFETLQKQDIMKWGVVYFMYKTGCRISEALELKLDPTFENTLLKEDFELTPFQYTPKGQKTWGGVYTKFVYAETFKILAKKLSKERKKRIIAKNEKLFFVNKHGNPMTYKNIQNTLKSIGITSHALRYTYAEEYRKKIIKSKEKSNPTLIKTHEILKRQMGHKNLSTTLGYCYSGEKF